MIKSPLVLTTPAHGAARSRNQHVAFWSRCLAAIATLLIVSLSLSHAAQSVTLAWDASSDPRVAGYKLRYGTAKGKPNKTIDAGKTTTLTVHNLNDKTAYFFAATSYNSAGIESKPSNEVSHVTNGTTSPSSDGPKYVLMVNGGTGDGSYPVGAQVPVTADAPQSGQQFAGWTGDTAILASPSAISTTAMIPSMDVAITATYDATATDSGLRGEYYNDDSAAAYPLSNPFKGEPVLKRTDATVDFDWGENSPGSPVSPNNFSVKWTGWLKAPVSGNYTFFVTADDGVRLFLNGTRLIEAWKDQGPTTYAYTTALTAGTLYSIELHFYEAGTGAVCRLHWSYPGQAVQTIPQSQLYPSQK